MKPPMKERTHSSHLGHRNLAWRVFALLPMPEKTETKNISCIAWGLKYKSIATHTLHCFLHSQYIIWHMLWKLTSMTPANKKTLSHMWKMAWGSSKSGWKPNSHNPYFLTFFKSQLPVMETVIGSLIVQFKVAQLRHYINLHFLNNVNTPISLASESWKVCPIYLSNFS